MALKKFSVMHAMRVVIALGWSDFSLKYRGSILGYAWSLVGPLSKFIVIAVIFGPFVQSDIPHYPAYLFLGIIIWEHFVATTVACINMPTEKEAVIRRLVFPRTLLILSIGYTNLLVCITHLVIFAIGTMAFTNLSFGLSSIYVILIILQMTLFALGVGMMLGSFSLKFKDIPHLWNVIVQMLFWLCPVVYRSTSAVPTTEYVAGLLKSNASLSLTGVLRTIAELQPLSIMMRDARSVLLYSEVVGVPSMIHTFVALSATGGIFMLGLWIFRKRSPYFLQEY